MCIPMHWKCITTMKLLKSSMRISQATTYVLVSKKTGNSALVFLCPFV